MDVSNGTPTDAKYQVSGGGSPVGHHGHFKPTEDTSHWPVIKAGAVVSVPMGSKGPWRICFIINDDGYVMEVHADNDSIHLAPEGDSFRADVRRVPHATHRAADHASA